MTAPVERFLEAHPDVAGAWYPLATRGLGRLLAVPGLERWSSLARRVHAVAQPAGWTTLVAEPTAPARPDVTALTVLSANLWHDWPRQHRWAERLGSVAALVEAEDVDVALLQEVARTPAYRADVVLAERLGMAVAYARANGALEALGFEEGVAVLSRHPIRDVHLRQLGQSRNPLVRRVALAAELDTPLGGVLAVSAHLGLRRSANDRQIRALRAWVAVVSHGEVAIVGGDFNAPEERDEIQRTRRTWTDTFRRVHPHAEAATHMSNAPWRRWSPARRLDYVFLQQPPSRHWHVVDAGHLDAPEGPHSDHRAVLARVVPER